MASDIHFLPSEKQTYMAWVGGKQLPVFVASHT